ncbi:hypothetical protein KKF81_05415 [Candidatus Micrarchaeota archaeon]|nr:hypothetical protein [Candidatus Micrarchaeota archaeon]MBU1166366.1 hypothetical protein [Candidatus Micrarchaeota archaeon]MBU1886890.1 hypothetical protein [Candidatus Micrarchaeota archaeon]
MKNTEVNLEDEGFEELETGKGGSEPANAAGGAGNRPDFRIVQTDRDKEGKAIYTNVGGMWKNVSKNGNEFYTLKIGQLKLLVFANDKK